MFFVFEIAFEEEWKSCDLGTYILYVSVWVYMYTGQGPPKDLSLLQKKFWISFSEQSLNSKELGGC